jgi:hypothetical protein
MSNCANPVLGFALVTSLLLMDYVSLFPGAYECCLPVANMLSIVEQELLVREVNICSDPVLRPYLSVCMELVHVLPSIGLRSPMRSDRNWPRIIYEVVGTGRSSGFRSQLCSFPVSGIRLGALVFACLDLAVAEIAGRSGANVILLNATRYSVFARYCLKFIFNYVLACLEFESFLIDSDIVFLASFSQYGSGKRTSRFHRIRHG